MSEYIELDLMSDPDALAEEGFDFLATVIPGYTTRPGNIETVLTEANAQIGADVVEQVSQVPPILFSYFGQAFLGLPMREALPAVATAAITFAPESQAMQIDDGWQLLVPNPSGIDVAFTTDDPLLAPAGGGVVTVGITAMDPGMAGNGSFGIAEPIEQVEWVTLIEVTVPAINGSDEESDDDYLNRLSEALSIYAPRPILAVDHATMARQVEGVGKTTALDLYQPGTDDQPVNSGTWVGAGPANPVNAGAGVYGVERCVTTVILDEQGNPPSQALKQSVFNLLDQSREVNFYVYVIGPSTHMVDVTVTVVAYPNYSLAAVKENAENALREWLANWTGASVAGTGGTSWVNDTKLRINEVIDYVNRADGVWYAESPTDVTFAVDGAAPVSTDVVLTGPAPLPIAGNIVVTVKAPPSSSGTTA
jgi:hypothetical protein